MRLSEEIRGLKKWTYEQLCKGREMKTPAENMDASKICRQEPKVFFAFLPTRDDASGYLDTMPLNTVPGIVILPQTAYAKNMEEQRFDRYNNIHRPKNIGKTLNVRFLFMVFEDGVRLPGFVDKYIAGEGMDLSLVMEGSEEGVMLLLDWMDDCMRKLLGQKNIPGTDLAVTPKSVTYDLYTDQKYLSDKRSVFYGFVDCIFQCETEEQYNDEVEAMLDT
jgi:hypothetical protein